MTLKLTERDKKLLVILAVFILIVGIGAGVLMPLMDKGQELQEKAADARIEQQEREQKVVSLPVLRDRESTVLSNIEEMKKEFYPVMKSMEIDKMLTELALSKGLTVKDLDIKMPSQGEYSTIKNYTAFTDESETETANDGVTYNGIYTAAVSMTLHGSRGEIQSMMDDCAANEPGMRITDFTWQKVKESEARTLGMTLEIYMCRDTEQYIMEQQAAQAAAKAAEQAAQTNAAEETEE